MLEKASKNREMFDGNLNPLNHTSHKNQFFWTSCKWSTLVCWLQFLVCESTDFVLSINCEWFWINQEAEYNVFNEALHTCSFNQASCDCLVTRLSVLPKNVPSSTFEVFQNVLSVILNTKALYKCTVSRPWLLQIMLMGTRLCENS